MQPLTKTDSEVTIKQKDHSENDFSEVFWMDEQNCTKSIYLDETSISFFNEHKKTTPLIE